MYFSLLKAGQRWFLIKWAGYELRVGSKKGLIKPDTPVAKGDWEPEANVPASIVKKWTRKKPDWWSGQA